MVISLLPIATPLALSGLGACLGLPGPPRHGSPGTLPPPPAPASVTSCGLPPASPPLEGSRSGHGGRLGWVSAEALRRAGVTSKVGGLRMCVVSLPSVSRVAFPELRHQPSKVTNVVTSYFHVYTHVIDHIAPQQLAQAQLRPAKQASTVTLHPARPTPTTDQPHRIRRTGSVASLKYVEQTTPALYLNPEPYLI